MLETKHYIIILFVLILIYLYYDQKEVNKYICESESYLLKGLHPHICDKLKTKPLDKTLINDCRDGFIRGMCFGLLSSINPIESGLTWALITPVSNLIIKKIT